MPDIVITPNRGTTSNPKIDFTGTSAGTIKLEVLSDGTIAWNGANGSLFSIADSLSGSLMSVNDISGLPAFEVFSDNRVIVGQFGANLLLGKTTSSSNGRLQLTSHTTNTGGIGFGSDVTLFRSAADILKTEDSFHVNGEIYALASGGGLKLSASSTTGLIVALQGGGIQFRNSSNANLLTLADAGNVTVNSGTLTATQLISNIAQGTAPLVVTSSTQVSNLNAQYLNGYSSDTANTANAIVRRDGSGFINATAIQTSSGGSNGVRVHSNSGITASNNYMNFFTSQTNGWAFNTNGTGADANTVAVINASGNVGINNTSPSYKLDVTGDTRISGNLLAHKVASYTTSYPGISSFGANAVDTASITYYDTGKTLPNTLFRGVVWTGKHYIFTNYSQNRAYFYNNNFDAINNAYGVSYVALPMPSGYSSPHGAAWDGRYLWTMVTNGTNVKIVGYDIDTSTNATIIAESAGIGVSTAFDVEYADGHLYFTNTGTLYIYKWNGSTIDQVATKASSVGSQTSQGITYDGSYLWAVQNGSNIYKINLDGTQISTIGSGSFPSGICGWAWNGSNIVALEYDTQKIYIFYTSQYRIDTEKLTVMGGNVGVATTDPAYRLQLGSHFSGTQAETSMFINAGGATTAGAIFISPDGNSSVGAKIGQYFESPANIQRLDLGTVGYSGVYPTVSIEEGKVGIGTTAPQRKLDILGGDIMVRSTSDTGTSVVNFGSTTYYPRASIRSTGLASPVGDANLSFWTRNSGTEYERITILNNGNVGIAAPAPGYKLEVTGDAYITEALKQGNVETRSFAVTFSDGVANRATDIRFPNTYINGLIEVEVTSSYSNQNSVGVVKKIFSVGANPTNSIWNTTVARVVEAHGVAADNWTIGDFAWDATNSKYIIPVYHIVSSGNVLNINIRYFSQAAVSSPVLPTTTVSAQYTATIPAAYQTRHYVYYNDRLGIGTSAPSTLFQVAGNNVGNFRLDTNGSGGHYYQTESNARLGLGRDLITSAGHISFTMAGGSVNTLGAAITMPANSQLGFYTSNGSSLIERVRIDGSGNVGVNSTNPSTLLNVQGSFATRNFKVFTWSTLSANATQARRYEIARLGHDTVNWDSTGVFEVEIYQQYYSRPVKKRYMVSYGYPGGGVAKLVEYQNSSTSGYGANNFQVTLGTEVVTSGNFKYLPVYIDIRYYAIIDVRVNTNWNHSTTNSSPGAGLAYINESPSPTNISDFTADSVVSLTSDNNAVFESSVGVGISTTPNYKLEISGTVGLSGFSGGSYRKLATPSYWGYNNAYKSIILGSSSTTYNTNDGAVTLCFGVDISGNASGSFTGDGRELVFRNLTRFVTPNGSNDNYLNPLTFNNGSVGIAIDSPSFKFQVAGAGSIGDGAFIVSGNTASSSFYDQNTGAYLHTPGAMIRKDSSRTTPQTSEATLVLYNKNGTDATNTKLVFASNETTSTSANPVATAAIVSEKVSGTAGGWAVGNLQFLVKNGANYTNSVVVDNTGVTVAGALTVQDGTESTNTFGLKTFTKSLTVTTSWSDVGISGSDLATGTYIIQVTVDNYDVSGGQYQERYSGVMSWIAGVTNSTDVDEIVLHKAGHAPNGNWINLRTVRQAPNLTMKLQIIASGNTSAADNYIFKFRRMI